MLDQIERTLVCQNNHPMAADAKFCGECGAKPAIPRQANTTVPALQQQQRTVKKKPILLIVLAAIALAGLILGIIRIRERAINQQLWAADRVQVELMCNIPPYVAGDGQQNSLIGTWGMGMSGMDFGFEIYRSDGTFLQCLGLSGASSAGPNYFAGTWNLNNSELTRTITSASRLWGDDFINDQTIVNNVRVQGNDMWRIRNDGTEFHQQRILE